MLTDAQRAEGWREHATALAQKFHEAYERLAPQFGYETRPDTREIDLSSANGRLMVAVCTELIAADIIAYREEPRA